MRTNYVSDVNFDTSNSMGALNDKSTLCGKACGKFVCLNFNFTLILGFSRDCLFPLMEFIKLYMQHLDSHHGATLMVYFR